MEGSTLVNPYSGASALLSAVRSFPVPLLLSDVTNDISEKSFTVPANHIYKLLWAFALFVTTAAAGNRKICISVLNTYSTELLRVDSNVLQAASLTKKYNFFPSISLQVEAPTGIIFLPLPTDIIIPASYTLRIADENSIAGDTDDLHIWAMVNDFTISEP